MAGDEDQADGDQPSLRQRLHAATGDRGAEAKALADQAGGEVTEEDAKEAVQRAHGDSGARESPIDHDIATPDDAKEEGRDPD